jgi:hypothetical protein
VTPKSALASRREVRAATARRRGPLTRCPWWILGLALALGCSRPPAPGAAVDASAGAPRTPAFVDRVWSVERSTSVAPGTLYVFLSDGTLVITSSESEPMLGSWSRSETGLVMVEESVPYRVDILELEAGRFVIRSHNPGEPVDITLVPAATEGGPRPAGASEPSTR